CSYEHRRRHTDVPSVECVKDDITFDQKYRTVSQAFLLSLNPFVSEVPFFIELLRFFLVSQN
ncbi:MAG: hypothetical protein NHB14_16430, partial [Desulfosporosinus sp.]|nr:hypothetical protein [Desulfosporosinus sp.]